MSADSEIVFVVDDDKPVRDSLKFSLELDGLSIKVCADGRELLRDPALASARCLVLDYRMPTMDAFELIDALAAQHIEVPVILITSTAADALRKRAQAAGVRSILEKPLLDSALLDAINGVLRPH